MALLRQRERRWRVTDRLDREQRPPTALLVALVLGAATLLTLDYHGGPDGPLEPARRVVGEAFGPAEAASAALVRPFTAVPAWFDSRGDLRDDVARLSAENAELKEQVRTSGVDRHRLAEYDALTATAEQTGRALVPARVIGLGSAQSFTRTVTIDAGSRAGVRPDQTVVAADGLVGRVLRTTDTTATVLLVLDADSVVGGRVGESMELGFLKGRGVIGGNARLDLELIDGTTVPGRGEPVVTWGSEDGAPYVAGIPIGQVTQVFTSVRDSSKRAVIAPYVDFSSLDVVGVVVASGTPSDRALIEADGSLR